MKTPSPGGDITPATFMQQMFTRRSPAAVGPSTCGRRTAIRELPARAQHPPRKGGAQRHDHRQLHAPGRSRATYGRATVPIFLSETGYLLGQQLDRRYPPVTEANRANYMSRAFGYYWRAWPELIGVAPFGLSDPDGIWSGWNWVEPDGSQHAQYASIRGLDRSYPYRGQPAHGDIPDTAGEYSGRPREHGRDHRQQLQRRSTGRRRRGHRRRANGHGYTHANAIGDRDEHRHGRTGAFTD